MNRHAFALNGASGSFHVSATGDGAAAAAGFGFSMAPWSQAHSSRTVMATVLITMRTRDQAVCCIEL